MYNITVFGRETLAGTLVSVSISETDDNGNTEGLTGFSSMCNDDFPGLAWGSLENFLEQTCVALYNTLSTNRTTIAQSKKVSSD